MLDSSLLAACVLLLSILLLVAAGIRSSLGRIERLLAGKKEAPPAQISAAAAEAAAGGAFENFLNADPARRLLSKKEQSAAYRQWRQENGMNWTNS